MTKQIAFRKNLNKDFKAFIKTILRGLKKAKINLSECTIDHACFRVKTAEQYKELQCQLNDIGELLIETNIGGRNISTYRLFEPLVGEENLSINIIELPDAKPNNQYELGFEHAEFVIDESFEEFAKRYDHLDFDWKGTKKAINPELRYQIDEKVSVKFHRQTLESVITLEQRSQASTPDKRNQNSCG